MSRTSIEDIKSMLRDNLFDNIEEMFQDIKQLPPKDRVDRRLKLMDFVMPKVQSVQANDTNKASHADELLAREALYDDEEL